MLKVTDNGRGIEHTDLLKNGSFGSARHAGEGAPPRRGYQF